MHSCLRVADISGGEERIPVSFVNEIDSEHLPKTWTYSSTNVPGKGSHVEDFETGLVGCTCVNYCSKGSCKCVVAERMVECGDFCPCPDSCINRLVQHGVNTPLQVFRTSDSRGFGVRSLKGIVRGSFVCEYAGEVIGVEEAGLRALSQIATDGNYLLVLKEHSFVGGVVHSTIFDPRYIGNVGRFINHSCEPNLYAVPVRAINAVPRLCFYTMRDVEPLEELSYNYAGSCTSTDDENCDLNRIPCLCGASSCRQFLPFDPSLLKTEQNFL